jgi:mono/diheme cytochrome c family protein
MENKHKNLIVITGLMIILVSCSGGSVSTSPTSSPTTMGITPIQAPQSINTQAASLHTPTPSNPAAGKQNQAGQQVYQANCSACHGSNLEGSSAPALSPSVLVNFGNAQGILQFVSSQMPQGSPGSLSHQQYLDVTAYLLHHDNLIPNQVVDDNNAVSLKLHISAQAGTATPAGTPSAQEEILVREAEIPTLGTFLTDNRGYTLYTYTKDRPGVSQCTGNCAYLFKPLTVSDSVQPALAAGIPGKLMEIKRTDGTLQVTYSNPPNYDRIPLYTYYGDTQPGQTQGNAYQNQWETIHVSASTAQATPSISPTFGAVSQGNAALGAPIYMKNCSPCHGAEGQGVDAPPLRNSSFIQNASDQTVFNTIANGLPNTEMPAWLQSEGGPLRDQQITHVVAYLHSLQGVSQLPTATPEPPEPKEPTLLPGTPTPEPAQPSNSGGAGAAVGLSGSISSGKPDFGLYCASCHGPQGVLGVPNPGSEDESVPPLNPIDPTIANPNPDIFSTNLDLFIEHGSAPEGPNPLILMPSFGDKNLLTDQQIADIIAYVMNLNGVQSSK